MVTDMELIDSIYRYMSENKVRLAVVADALQVAPETISRWRKSGIIARKKKNQIAGWLASKGVNLSEVYSKCYLEKCPAEKPVDHFMMVILESWDLLSQEQRSQVAGVAAKLAEPNKRHEHMAGVSSKGA